jgi:hypothetical protein
VVNGIQRLRWARTRQLRAAALVAIVLIAASGWRPAPAAQPSVRTQDAGAAAAQAMAHLPLSFVENRGQLPGDVLFYARDAGADLLFTPSAFVTRLRGAGAAVPPADLRVEMIGTRTDAAPISMQRAGGVVNIFEGNDPSRWLTGIPTHARIGYTAPWPGIDVWYDGHDGRLESTYAVAAGADPGLVRLRYSGHDGLSLAPDGGLLISTPAGMASESAPVIYQELGAQRVHVGGRFDIIDHDTVGFVVADYDHRYPLLIDPLYTHAALAYSTFLGGSGSEQANAIAVGSDGSAYIAGFTTSSNAPGQTLPNVGARDAFVIKLSPTGGLGPGTYTTYFGGLDVDEAKAIAVNAAGEAYVTGSTASGADPITGLGAFPTISPYQAANAGGAGTLDAFVTRLATNGAPNYSTYLGGGGDDTGRGIALGTGTSAGKVFVTGTTLSADFPLFNQPALNALLGLSDAFVTELDPATTPASQLVYSQYLGGSLPDNGRAIAVDASGNAYVTGSTGPTNAVIGTNDFPTTTGPIGPGGLEDAFVTKITLTTGARVYSTRIGGSITGPGTGTDGGYGIAVDGSGSAYVTGLTHSADFPLTTPLQPTWGGGDDAFVIKLTPAGTGRVYSTYLGGSGGDAGAAIAVSTTGEAFVTGSTFSANFPNSHAFQSQHIAPTSADAFVTRINAAGNAYVYSTYLGGESTDRGWGIAVDGSSNAYVAGATLSATNFPTLGPYQPANAGLGDAFAARIALVTSSVGGVSTAPDPAALPARGAGSRGAAADPVALAVLAGAALAALSAVAYRRRPR